MRYRTISSLLGVVAYLMGACALLCIPWGARILGGGPNEGAGIRALLSTCAICVSFGALFSILGRGANRERLFRKDAIVGVTFSWILAILLGTLPFLLSGCERIPGDPLTFIDALFESASGLTTTGATVFGELDDPKLLPRTILFWRGLMQFLGGLGVMCFFVAILGQGPSGKTVMRLERSSVTNIPVAKMRELASSLFAIYLGLTCACAALLLLCGMSLFDAIFYSFSVVSLGGMHSHNLDGSSPLLDDDPSSGAIQVVAIIFMIAAATNYWLIYWTFTGKPSKLFHDFEWRAFMGILLGAIIIATAFGIGKEDFKTLDEPTALKCEDISNNVERWEKELALADRLLNENGYDEIGAFLSPDEAESTVEITNTNLSESVPAEASEVSTSSKMGKFFERAKRFSCTAIDAFCASTFHVTSFATGAGFATRHYELWNSTTLLIFMMLMIVGGCSGSTTGGVKIYRVVLAWKALTLCAERLHSPHIVRAPRMHGENVDQETVNGAFAYVAVFCLLIFITIAVVMTVEPDTIWGGRLACSQNDKFVDLSAATIAMYSNVGAALGALSSYEDFGELSAVTKFIFCWAMLLGRLEIWYVLAIFSPNFWRNR